MADLEARAYDVFPEAYRVGDEMASFLGLSAGWRAIGPRPGEAGGSVYHLMAEVFGWPFRRPRPPEHLNNSWRMSADRAAIAIPLF